MKKLGLLLLLGLYFISGFAQGQADIIVSYNEKEWNYKKDTVVNQNMTLLLNKNISKYFNEVSQWSDSLSSTPEGEKQLKEIIMAQCVTTRPDGSIVVDYTKGPVKNIYTYIVTDIEKGELTHYGKWGTEKRFYKEPVEEMTWEIGDSTKNILGYECIKAETDYHGRHWEAWFTPEIPVAFGPWKLRGLPGLILNASAGKGFEFTASGLQTSDRIITPIFKPGNYSKTKRKKALADEEYYQNNRQAIISAEFGGNVQFSSGFSDGPKYDRKKYSLEPDYKE